MDPVSTVVDLDPSHFGFSRGLENTVWLNGGQVSYCNISWDRSYNSTKGSEQVWKEDEDAIFREWNHSIRRMCQKSVTYRASYMTMLNIQIVGEEQVPISLLCYVYPILVYIE